MCGYCRGRPVSLILRAVTQQRPRQMPSILQMQLACKLVVVLVTSIQLVRGNAGAQTINVTSATISVSQLNQVDGRAGIGAGSLTSGLGKFDHTGVVRRDPSDVIRLGDQYYVFFTKMVRLPDGVNTTSVPNVSYFTGYASGEVWYATSINGTDWVERGRALGLGAPGAWDSASVFTPNVVCGLDGELYLYYTGIDENGGDYNGNDIWNSDPVNDITQIGVAQLILDGDGGVIESIRLNGADPILSPTYGEVSAGLPKFDSFRVDDSSLLLRDYDNDGVLEYGLYYKGRAEQGSPKGTRMGLAIADKPAGPYVRQNGGKPVQPEGHEVLIWSLGTGVMSLATATGEGLYYAADGVHFKEVLGDITGKTKAPGAFRKELTDHTYTGGVSWGISMSRSNPGYLNRYTIKIDSDNPSAR